jgi:hypothetical protein
MNTAKQVDELITQLKGSGIPLADAAWQAAKACIGWPYIFGDRGEYCTPQHRRAAYANKGEDHPTIKTKCRNFDGSGSCSGCSFYPGGKTRAFDCRGFTYWILLQIYGWKLMGAGATSQWNNDENWKAKGEIGTMPQGVIVCLFYREKKNAKVMAHTGLGYNGETIECSNGVQYSKTVNKKWEYWAIPACVGECGIGEPAYYERPANDLNQAPQQAASRPTIWKGIKNKYVKECQEMLQKLGYDLGICGVDSDFGTATRAAVMSFQSDHGLQVDGVVGADTWAALDAAVSQISGQPAEKKYSVIISGLDKTQAEALAGNYPGARIIEGSVV